MHLKKSDFFRDIITFEQFHFSKLLNIHLFKLKKISPFLKILCFTKVRDVKILFGLKFTLFLETEQGCLRYFLLKKD